MVSINKRSVELNIGKVYLFSFAHIFMIVIIRLFRAVIHLWILPHMINYMENEN